MKIAIVNLTGGGLSGGYIKYLSQIIPEIKRHRQVRDLFVFLPQAFGTLLERELAPEAVFPCLDTVSGRTELQKTIRQLSPDVVFFPSYRWLDLGPIPTVAMIRNMEPLISPWGSNCLLDTAKNLLRAYSARKACHRANRVIAVSHFVKDFLMSSWQVPAVKIGVVSHGVAEAPAAENLPSPEGLNPDWDGNFWFTAGSIRPYRGLEDIIVALGHLGTRGERPNLVIAGAASRLTRTYQRKIEALARLHGVATQIFWTGHLTAAKLSWCFYHSRIFLMTSRIEACPNIALEAMSHGCLCLSADNPPLPEVFGDAAVYYRSYQGDSLAAAVAKLQQMTAEKQEKIRIRARDRAREFTWKNTAERTILELQMASNG